MGEKSLSRVYLTLDEQKAHEKLHWFMANISIYYAESTNSYC
jgi:hypothetical protein